MNTFEKATEVIRLIQKEMNEQRFQNAEKLTSYLKLLFEQLEVDKRHAQLKTNIRNQDHG